MRGNMPNIFDETEDINDSSEEESKANWQAWNEHEQLIDTSFNLVHNLITAIYDQLKGSETCISASDYVHIPEGFKEFLLTNELHIKDSFNTLASGYRQNQQAMFHLMAEKKPSNN